MELLYQYKIYLSNYSRTTQKLYYNNVLKYLEYLRETKGNDSPITIMNVRKADIYNYIAYMDNLNRENKQNRLKAAMSFYKSIDPFLSRELFEDIKLYNKKKRLPHCLSLKQTKELINYYPDKRNRLIIYLLLTTGIRLNEITNIRTKDINLEEKTIKILAKGNKQRIVFINNKCRDMIKDYASGDRLFNLSYARIAGIVKTALINLGYKGSTHTLRHTAASLMYNHTKDILLVKEFLGHERIETTQIYTHINNEEVRKAVNSNPLANWGC